MHACMHGSNSYILRKILQLVQNQKDIKQSVIGGVVEMKTLQGTILIILQRLNLYSIFSRSAKVTLELQMSV